MYAQPTFCPKMTQTAIHHLPPGTVVSVFRGLYSHIGILTESVYGQERHVISLNPGWPGAQVIEEPLSQFSRGKPVSALPSRTSSPAWVTLSRARSGQHPPYSWVNFNCEHFVNFALGTPIRSPQLVLWGIATAALLMLNR
jgi:hypothetical protein